MNKSEFLHQKNSISINLNSNEPNFLKNIVRYIVLNKNAYESNLISSQELGSLVCGLIMYQDKLSEDFNSLIRLSCDLELPDEHVGGDRVVMTKELVEKIESLESKYLK